jgi:uroporphyrinogen III methyltransferase/synthase
MNDASMSGKIFLVGAGPGDPGLITLRGVECLRQADLVLFDYLVNPQIVDHAPPSAERVCLHRHARDPLMSAQSVIARMIAEAEGGKTVVRLKGGDPAVFGHLAEEMAAIKASGIAVEVVPGVTAGLAAAALAGMPITCSRYASAVALVTGHRRGDNMASDLDYAALAKFPGTLIFYMGVGTAAAWSTSLMREGKPATTAVAVVQRSSWPDQTVVCCTLGTVAAVIAEHRIAPPAVILVGDAAASR